MIPEEQFVTALFLYMQQKKASGEYQETFSAINF